MRYADANSLTKHAGDKWDFIIRGRDASDKVRSYAAQKTFPRDFTFSAAHCTPISISAASISEAGAVLSSIEQGEASSSRINSIVRFPTNSSVVRIEYFLFESFYKDYWWNWGPQIHEKTGSYTLTEADKAAGFCKISIPAVSPGEYIVAVDSFDEFGIQGNSVSEHHTVSAVAPVEEGIIKRRFGMHHLNISQGRFAGFSHTNLNAYDLAGEDTGIDYFRAYATYEVIGIHRWDGTSSTFANTIHFYDAENDITLALTHMDSISADYYIGRKFYSGDVMYMEGQAGRATGNHIHLEVAEGRQASKTYFAVNGTYNYQLVNKLDIEEYFYLTSGETVVNAAGYSFERR